MKRRLILFAILWTLLVCGHAPASDNEPGPDAFAEAAQKAREAGARGDFAAAARLWASLADNQQAAGQILASAENLIRVSEACLAMGNVRKGLDVLDRAEKAVQGTNARDLTFLIEAGRANLYSRSGEYGLAEMRFRKCFDLAETMDDPRRKAVLNLHYGNHLFGRREYGPALSHYDRCLAAARDLQDENLFVKAGINALRVRQVLNPDGVSARDITKLLDATHRLPKSHDAIFSLIGIGRMAARSSLTGPAWGALTSALAMADKIGDTRSGSQALGALGALYVETGQTGEALESYRRAIFKAQAVGAADLLYRWEWGLGRQYALQGDVDRAVNSYEQAVAHITEIKEDLAADCRRQSPSHFRETVGPVYFELADLLLKRSAFQSDPKKKQKDLEAVQNTLEEMKKMELQDYFQDDCVIAMKTRESALNRPLPGTAVVYPVLLPDRLEIIVTFPGVMKQYAAAVEAEELTAYIRNLRKKLEDPSSRFLRYSQKLYDWLVLPFASDLARHGIHTLVFVPDGPLRTIPMAALNDGQAFLIEQYAVATTPGLVVTDLMPFSASDATILLTGITEGVQGFSPLPEVARELSEIRRVFDAELLLNGAFNSEAIQKSLQLKPFNMVHIASHGQFGRDPAQTFVLTHKDRLTLDRLEMLMGLSHFRKEPVSLLTLSACQTAMGDDRAALGLAGIAVKSGARSALASLWSISDRATSLLVVEFYRNLKENPMMSKAEALQSAQNSLIQSVEWGHPAFWAPFLLIGNWL